MNKNQTPGQATAAAEEEPSHHYFSLGFAKEHGVPEAIVAKFIAYKVRSSKNVRNNKKWFYDPIRELAKRYPYIPPSTMDKILKRLESNKLLEIDSFNRRGYDRTGWYTVPQEVMDAVEKKKLIRVDVEIAAELGIPAGVLIENLRFWVQQKAEKRKKGDTMVVYHEMSPARLAKDLPCFAPSTIKRALKRLTSAGRIIKHTTEEAMYALPEMAQDGGSERDKARSKWEMGGSERDNTGSNRDEGGSKRDNNTHCKPLSNPIDNSVGKPFKEEEQASPAPAFESDSSRTDDTILAKGPASPQASHPDSPSSPGIKGCAGHVKDDRATGDSASKVGDGQQDAGARIPVTDESKEPQTYDQLQTVNKGNSYYFDFKDKSIDWQRQPANDPGVVNIKLVRVLCWGFIDSLDDATLYSLHRIKERDELVAQVRAQFLPYFNSKAEQSSVAKKLGLWVFKNVFFNASLEFAVNAFISLNDNYFHYMHSIENIWPYVSHLESNILSRVRDYNTHAWQQWLEARKKQFASVDQHRESDISLAPAEKARVLRNALQSSQQVGYLDDLCQHEQTPITFSDADLEVAEKLFELNRGFCVSQLLGLIDQCVEIHLRNDVPEGHDKHYHARRGCNLGFFLKHAAKIAGELESPVLNGWTSLPTKEEEQAEEPAMAEPDQEAGA